MGSLDAWAERLTGFGATGLARDTRFGEARLLFDGPDADSFALVETSDDPRAPWTGNGVGDDMAIRGFHSADMRLSDGGASAELLRFMGYEEIDQQDNVTRFAVPHGNHAEIIELGSGTAVMR